MPRAVRDANRVTTLIVVSNAGDEAEVQLWADPTTHRLLVDATFNYTGVIDDEAVDAGDFGTLILGTDGTNYQVVATDSDGHLQVELADKDTDDDSIAKEQELPLIINENYIFDKVGDDWVRMQGSTDGYLFVRTLGLYSDGGTSLTLATQADDIINTTDTLLTSGFNYWFDGTTWDRARGDSTNGLLVNLGSNNDISGTVTANLSATDNTVLDNIDTSTASQYITGGADGVTTVTTAGTDVALAASTPCKRVTIQAQTDNTGLIAVGFTGVDATEATGTGIILYAGDSIELDIDNLADIFIDSTVNGEGVRYVYFT